MHRQGSPWPLHGLSTTRKPWLCQVRRITSTRWPKVGKIPMRNTFPTFQIFNLLLDLDAEGNKHVRTYDRDVDGVPEHPGSKREREQTALKLRIAKFDKEYEQEKATFLATITGDKFGRWRINDLDILSAALQGPSQINSADATILRRQTPDNMLHMSAEEMTEPIMIWNGVPRHAMNSTSKSISYMLRQKQLAARKIPPPSDAIGLKNALQGCHSFIEFKRLVRQLLETTDGSQLLSRSSGKIGEICSRQACVPDPELVMDVLSFVNDVHMNLAAKDLNTDEQLRSAGLLLAVRCSAFGSAQNYLTIDTDVGGTSSHLIDDLDKSLHRLLWSIIGHHQDQQDFGVSWEPSQRRVAVFSLMTGHNNSGHTFANSFRNIIHSIRSTDHKSIRPFIHILGELGALRTLWYEFQRLSELDGRNQRDFADEFVSAFTRTRNNIKNGRISLPALKLAGDGVAKGATGIFEDDCQLDLIPILQPSDIVSAQKVSLDAIPPYLLSDNHQLPSNLYSGFEREEVGGSKLRERTLDAFCQPGIEDAMLALKLILDSA